MSLKFDKKHAAEFVTLTSLLGISEDSLLEYMNWCLLEQLVAELASDKMWFEENRNRPDARALFKEKIQKRTGATWDTENAVLLYERVKSTTEKHYRQPVTYGELLRLLINSPLQCANEHCRKSPPEVKLHIDHIFPSSKGGSSKYENLQFLCDKCNLSKSNKLQKSDIWLKLKSLQLS